METTNLENDAKQVTFIADALRESVFQRLSYYKENCKSIHQKYSDSNWAGTAYRAHCGYYYKREFFYNPFCLESYQGGSDEWKVLHENLPATDSLKETVMKLLLDEWIQQEQQERRKQQREQRIRHIKEQVEENEAVAEACGIPVDMVMAIELKEALQGISLRNDD